MTTRIALNPPAYIVSEESSRIQSGKRSRARKRLKPGSNGTKCWPARFGEKVIGVRCREHAASGLLYIAAEIIDSDVPCAPLLTIPTASSPFVSNTTRLSYELGEGCRRLLEQGCEAMDDAQGRGGRYAMGNEYS